ncbi:hypothetical protein RCH09_003215 [Actimicrobium sp. GrIS 1.19]|uniref:hypothetical protein n=1 Tax=Actimicrobium sp. GrIS 1.19 TaxID=3071708 RepID=UPI002E004289|nr:hypothetical protein [Actimicrobium sp. GrIS 1.19]
MKFIKSRQLKSEGWQTVRYNLFSFNHCSETLHEQKEERSESTAANFNLLHVQFRQIPPDPYQQQTSSRFITQNPHHLRLGIILGDLCVWCGRRCPDGA